MSLAITLMKQDKPRQLAQSVTSLSAGVRLTGWLGGGAEITGKILRWTRDQKRRGQRGSGEFRLVVHQGHER